MNGLVQTLRNLGFVRLAALAMVAALSIGFFGFVTSRITTPGFGLLFSDLDSKDSGEIVQKLEAMGVAYQIKGDSSAIMVPVDQVPRLRMLMANDGLPHGGSVGYEIFDKSDAFGTSSFVENINQVRALEGELARTISSISMVQSARVHLVLPRREVFSRDRQEPSASIVAKLRGAGRLTTQQVAAIQHLVAAAVPDLHPDRVSVIDTEGNLLARGGGTGDAMASDSTEEMRVNYENRLSQKLEDLLDRTVGPGKSRVDVHVELEHDRTTTNSEIYDPNGQVVRSTQTTTEANDSSEGGAAQPVSVANNLPNAQAVSGPANTGRTKGSRNEETVNYEITKTVKSQVREAGQVVKQSIAVLVDGNYAAGTDGVRKYQPRSADDLKQLTALVRSAVGFDEKRGDAVDVVNLQFAAVDEPEAIAPQTIMGFEKADLMHMGETLILAVVALLVILLVIRPLVNRVLDSAATAATSEVGRLLGGPPAAAALPAPGSASGAPGTALAQASFQRALPAGEGGEMIDLNQVDGRVAASSLRKVTEIVEKHPEEALAIVRSWMYQEGR
ncbi:MAG TPA: flagellar basal-body MS-ring/collar protein FliF [Stellaceae bacterium]|nr:flagellar basal-body MS-ring/collar protein FliF [Stellaceae bacterium]